MGEGTLGDQSQAYRLAALSCTFVAGFAIFACIAVVAPFIEIIRVDLATSYSDMGLLYSSPVLMLSLLAIAGGVLADRIGVRRAGGLGLTILGLGAFLRGSSANFSSLLIYTLLLGVGMGLVFPSIPKFLGAWFPNERMGLAMGVFGGSTGIGSIAALGLSSPVLLPLLGGWREVFLFWGGFTLASAAAWWLVVRQPTKSRTGLTGKLDDEKPPSGKWWQRRYLWILTGVFFADNIVAYASFGWFPTYFLSVGAPADTAAILSTMLAVFGIAGAWLVPALSDRIRRRKLPLWGTSLLGIAGSYLLLTGYGTNSWIASSIVGFSLYVGFSLPLLLPVELFEARFVGRASGVMMSVGYIGGVLGSSLIGYLRDLTGNFGLMPVVLGVGFAAMAGLTFALPETGAGRPRRNVNG